jgi:2-polyprenyl-3-methyl-5-hydroxy-6-metoxy-1,4-benzoquinol methylase
MDFKTLFRLKTPPSSNATADFYNNLTMGQVKRGVLGMDRRYSPPSPVQESFLQKYFDDEMRELIRPNDRILDFGCGPGTLTARLLQFSDEITGVDISQEFIRLAQGKNGVEGKKIDFKQIDGNNLDCLTALGKFDVVLMFDVVHHLENPTHTLSNLSNCLKEGGILAIFEPNCLSPAIFIMHLMDSNERGLLRFHRPSTYSRLLEQTGFQLNYSSFNSIVIGPANKLLFLFCFILELRIIRYIFGFLKPKIKIIASR